MRIIKSSHQIKQIVQKYKKEGKSLGFVPTMGALHEGHLSLFHRSKKENDITIASIFVNPTQFGPHEDFKKYPRNFKRDLFLAKKENVDIIFYPSVKEIYPEGDETHVSVGRIGDILCGKSRPIHFRGVATVVAKLLNIISPDKIYLGQKDAQQVIVIKRMVQNLHFNVKVVVCPTIREKDGLAMSSRNIYLNPQERIEARILSQSLKEAKQKIQKNKNNLKNIIQEIKNRIKTHSSGRIDYIECVDAKNLSPVNQSSQNILIALAVWFGKTRLIDNISISIR